jgi:transcriptional regulator with XRE-family HTH domain
MDDQKFGAVIRAARVKRRLTQRQVASAAGVSDGSVSRLERGHTATMVMATIRAICSVLDVRVELLPRSRAADLERTANAAHARLAEAVVEWLGSFSGWIVPPEIGFSNYGERGVIDLLCWHPIRRALLIIELKTEVVDINEVLGTLDRYVRNAAVAVSPFGWGPGTVARLLIVGESTHNRRRVAAHAALFAAAFPHRIQAVRAWLRDPAGDLSGLMFVRDRHPRSTRRNVATIRRVRNPARGGCEHDSDAPTVLRGW